MSLFNCNCRCNCSAAAVVVSALIGVISAFLQITGVITVTPVFLWVVFGIAVVYLGLLVGATLLTGRGIPSRCKCATLTLVLLGILGTVLLAVVLLAVGIVATSVVSAILVGVLLFFFWLILTGTVCLVRYLSDCGDCAANT